jgi:DNA-directed RNA polymerase subunit alpha
VFLDMSTAKKISEKAWSHVLKPYKVSVEQKSSDRRLGVLNVEPLERGFGVTIGNALRRVLLSSIQGTAVVAIRIEGVLSEFSHIPGVKEDVAEIILNIKQLELNLHSPEAKMVRLVAKGPTIVRASMLQGESTLELLNPDQYICSLDDGAVLSMDFVIERGVGYAPARGGREHMAGLAERSELPVGFIPIDAYFGPVKRVSFQVEKIRVGSRTDFDRLLMDIETNGSVTPKQAMTVGAKILQEQLDKLIHHEFLESIQEVVQPVVQEQDPFPFPRELLLKVEDLNLTVRSMNCLKSACIVYVGDLVRKTESDLLAAPNFGRKSLQEIRDKLHSLSLEFGMHIPNWPPQDIEQLSRTLGLDEN